MINKGIIKTAFIIIGIMYSFALNARMDNSQQKEIFLSILSPPSATVLKSATDKAEELIQARPDNHVAKLFYGYGQLFLATNYLQKKHYLQAVENAGRGFFFIDEAVESRPENWQLRYLRLRMDAFVPVSQGRCVVAIKDARYLLNQPSVLSAESLMMAVMAMQVRAYRACGHEQQVTERLGQLMQRGKQFTSWTTATEVVGLTDAERLLIIQPLLESLSDE